MANPEAEHALPESPEGVAELAAKLIQPASAAADRIPTWGWVVLVASLLALLAFGAWWWRKRREQSPDGAPKAAPALDLYADWKAFEAQLPRPLRRILDDLQPVILLGRTASEKHRVARQLSGVAGRERQYRGLVAYSGEGLDLYLGAHSLVLSPSEAFLGNAGSVGDRQWSKLLRRITRVRAPRVVVCLEQTPLDVPELERLATWTSKLRGQIDLIAEIRDEDIEVSVALAQSPADAVHHPMSPTAALFELVNALTDGNGGMTSSIPLADLTIDLKLGAEERHARGAAWVLRQVRAYRRGWPRLLADAQQDAKSMLALAHFFEHAHVWSESLGTALAELLGPSERRAPGPSARELCFLPFAGDRLVGNLVAFAEVTDEGTGRWWPRQSLRHRLVVASVVATLSVLMWLVYESDKSDWDAAATAALRYDPPEAAGELEVVKRYVGAGERRAPFSLPQFFERENLRCIVVSSARKYLRALLDHAVHASEPPEDVLQLVALYVTGQRDKCFREEDPNAPAYRELGTVIEQHIDEWRHVTGLTEGEISGYLALACPQTKVELTELEKEYGRDRAGEEKWVRVPSVAQFGAELQKLRGQCDLTAQETAAVQHAERIAGGALDIGVRHGAALSVLDAVRKLDTPSTALLAGVFDHYESRLQAIEDLGDEQEDMQLLARDLRPFEERDAPRRGEADVASLRALNAHLSAHLAGEVPPGEDVVIRFTVADNTYVIDRRKVRASLLVRALGELQQGFSETILSHERAAGTQELMFFSPEQYRRLHVWSARASTPENIHIAREVPWRYTVAGFQEAVLAPIEAMRQSLAAETCGEDAEEASRIEYVSRTVGFVSERLSHYLAEYADAWRDIYDSFGVSAASEAELSHVLTALSQPTSIHLALLVEVLRQTRLAVPEGFPFPDLLGLAAEPFATLPAALEGKTFADYQALLLELANAGQTERGNAAPRANPEPESLLSPDASLDDLAAGLSGFGGVILAGLRDPDQDVRARAQAWADSVGLAPALRGPLMQPIERAYALGEENLGRVLSRWWLAKARELDVRILNRFPFNPKSSLDATVEDVVSWLHPEEGVFSNEVLPMYRLVTRCGAEPCIELRNAMAQEVQAMLHVQRALFDPKGEPKALPVQLDPVPFGSQRFLPKRAVLKLGDVRHEYFNTAPRAVALSVPWNDAYVASLSVELVAAGSVDELALPITSPKSVWGFLHLLEAARGSVGGRYTWDLNVTLKGARRGKVSVSYDVCQDTGRCDGLLDTALGWR